MSLNIKTMLDDVYIGNVTDFDVDKTRVKTIAISLNEGCAINLGKCELTLKYPIDGFDVINADVLSVKDRKAIVEVSLVA